MALERPGWLAVVLALGLIGHGLLVLGLPLSNACRIEALLVLAVLIGWWIGVPGAPTGLAPAVYLPVLTAALSLGIVVLGLGIAHEEALLWSGPRIDFEGIHPARLDRFAWRLGTVLAFAAAALTGGTVGRATLAALLMATAALALLTRECRRVGSAYAAGLFWGLSCLYAALESASSRGIWDAPAFFGDVSLGGLAAVAGLWYASGWLRRSAPEVPPFLGPDAAGIASRDRLGRALERVAVLIAILTGLAASVPAAGDEPIADAGGWACVAALLGVSAATAGIAGRWGSRTLVYLSQAGLVGAYYASRPVVSPDGSADAAVLLGLAYLDLGIAEVLGGLRRDLYARPLRHAALVLPILSLLRRLDGGFLDDAGLFLLLTAAAFYGLAGLRIRGAGYAGLVLVNAFLWAAWARLGWSLDDHPQFFLIPVGLSAILFAEVEHRALGRNRVEAIRGFGLVLMYLSLALPIWRFQSLGAWLTVLLVSLAGIFASIGLRARSFLWLGLAGFVVDVLYQLGRVSRDDPLARWGIMLTLGLLLVLFVALNEKRRIVVSLRAYLGEVRRWE